MSADLQGDQTYLKFIDFGGTCLGGGLKFNTQKLNELKSVEVRFGSGIQQKAHRFSVTDSNIPGSGTYEYTGYIDVPFEVWDTENNTQLMISFRDQGGDGLYNLGGEGVELIFIHDIVYNESSNSNISANGPGSNLWYTVYPEINEGLQWNTDNIPDLKINIYAYLLKNRNVSSQSVTTWSDETKSNYAHADHHYLTIDNYGSPYRILDCNDGGVAISIDGGDTWESPNIGYNTSQFYGVAQHPEQLQLIGGMQDNGTAMSLVNPGKESDWITTLGGDGFFVLWNSHDSKQILISQYYNGIVRSDDGGQTWYDSKKEITDNNENTAPFITQLENSSKDPDLVFSVGKSGIWRSENFGKKWELIPINDDIWVNDFSNAIVAVSDADPAVVWAGTRFDANHQIMLSTDRGKTFKKVNTFNKAPGIISNIITHPKNRETVYVLFSYSGRSKIIKSSDFGKSWMDISGFNNNTSTVGFPDVAVYSMVVMPENDQELWAGTEIGLFVTNDGGNNWRFSNNGLPAVCIWDMNISGDRLALGTHGRGVWSLKDDRFKMNINPPVILGAGTHPSGALALKLSNNVEWDSVKISYGSEYIVTMSNLDVGESLLLTDTKIFNNNEMVQVTAFINGQKYFSNGLDLKHFEIFDAVHEYSNDFELYQNDFAGKGFLINSLNGFSGYGINSDHPYKENDIFTYMLKYPLIVADDYSLSTLSYKDIAFVEEGEQGSIFGSTDFYDYVIVEGTKNGVDWIPLTNGYDYRFSTKWKGGSYIIDDQPSENEYVTHTLNLQDNFNPNDTILVRFKLYSDPYSTGWGWIIDDLNVQKGIGNNDETPKEKLILKQNPFHLRTDIVLYSEQLGNGLIEIFNQKGQLINKSNFYKSDPNWSGEIFLPKEFAGVKFIRITINGKIFVEKFVLI